MLQCTCSFLSARLKCETFVAMYLQFSVQDLSLKLLLQYTCSSFSTRLKLETYVLAFSVQDLRFKLLLQCTCFLSKRLMIHTYFTMCLQLSQYKSVVFHGPVNSGKSYLTQRLAQCLAVSNPLPFSFISCVDTVLGFQVCMFVYFLAFNFTPHYIATIWYLLAIVSFHLGKAASPWVEILTPPLCT